MAGHSQTPWHGQTPRAIRGQGGSRVRRRGIPRPSVHAQRLGPAPMVKRNSATRDRHRARIKQDQPACHICGKPIDYTLPHLDPMSFVVDHVIPLAKGGPDALSNKKAAHRRPVSATARRGQGSSHRSFDGPGPSTNPHNPRGGPPKPLREAPQGVGVISPRHFFHQIEHLLEATSV